MSLYAMYDTPNDFCAALHMFALFISTMDCVQGHIFEIMYLHKLHKNGINPIVCDRSVNEHY